MMTKPHSNTQELQKALRALESAQRVWCAAWGPASTPRRDRLKAEVAAARERVAHLRRQMWSPRCECGVVLPGATPGTVCADRQVSGLAPPWCDHDDQA